MVKFSNWKTSPRKAVVKKDGKKTIMILALISVVLCGLPGCFLLVPGMGNFFGALESIQNSGDLLGGLGTGILQGGWLICLGSLLILIPIILVIIATIKPGKKDVLEDLVPTGVSKDDPIPPPS